MSMLLAVAFVGCIIGGARNSCNATPLLGNSFGVPGQNATYDYVVVGGGNAGLTIAARLAEDPKLSVAVIEAGSFYELDNGNGSVIPSLSVVQYNGASPEDTQPLIDWGFVTTPQAGAANRKMHYARGKTLGGCSARNYLAYHRGTKGAYQQWVDAVGDESYTFDNLLPYFQRSVNLTPPNNTLRGNGSVSYDPTVFSDRGGPLNVWWPNYASALNTYATKALAAVGIAPLKQNFQSGSLLGSAWTPSTVDPDNAHRDSSETSFLRQAIKQTSIKVYTHTFAKRITFGANNTAEGVLVVTGGRKYTLSARKEVILSAGAFQSPQLLMVSGVGPAHTLRQHNITVRKDLPGVGQNLWDQPLFGVSYRVNVLTSSEMLNNPQYAAMATKQYLRNQTGPLTAGPSFLAFEKLPADVRANLSRSTLAALGKFPSDWPEVEYLFQDGLSKFNENYMTADPMDGYNYATISTALIAPTSRGNVTISSADASDPPVINPNWLTTPADIEVAIAAFKRLRAIWAKMPVTIGAEYFPGRQVQTDEQILRLIRKSVIQLYHAAATCKMGKSDDPMAVVDSRARVYGTKRLRVVDASAFPFLTPGHPQSGVYMLAEKIADDIKHG